MTYRELLEKLSGLSNEQLDQMVRLSISDFRVVHGTLDILEEDLYDTTGGDGCDPMSAFVFGEDGDYPSEEDFIEEYGSPVWRAGEVFIVDDDRPRTCRVCGCTDKHGCEDGCWWVGPDLCSRCAQKEQS